MQGNNNISLDITKDGHTAKKFDCPSCGKKKRFVKYFNFDTGQYLPDKYGRCDREANCGYFAQPWNDKEELFPDAHTQQQQRKPQPKPKQEIKTVAREIVQSTLRHYEYNIFMQWLTSLVGHDNATQAAKRYFIGTAKNGGTIFWQIDRFMRVRTGQRFFYLQDGHRNKENPPKRLFTKSDGYEPCLFGEHLLYMEPDSQTIAIVESEKTAVIASIYLPTIAGKKVSWLASGGSNGLTEEKIKTLTGKEVILCPDFSYSTRASWGLLPMRKATNERGILIPDENGEPDESYIPYSAKIKAVGANVRFFDPYPHANDGSDIADYLIKLPAPVFYKKPDFRTLIIPAHTQEAENIPQRDTTTPNLHENEPDNTTPLTGQIPFKILKNQLNQVQDVLISPESLTQKVLTMLQKPQIALLIETFSIFEGYIEPLTDELRNTRRNTTEAEN